MVKITIEDPVYTRPKARLTDREAADPEDLGHILQELGACRWSGTARPLQAHVKSPAPDQLAEFERGGVNWFERIYPPDFERVRKNIADAARGGSFAPFEYRVMNARGARVWVRHWWGSDHRGPPSHPAGRVDGFVQIVDERKALEAECLRVSEHERLQIGQELHDDVCQILAGLACMLELFGRNVKAAIPTLVPAVNELVGELNGGMVRARTLAHGLVPLHLLSRGLPAALAELARQTTAHRGITVDTDFSRSALPHQAEQVLHLYRIAQEAISNAVKHGRATRIELKLRRHGRGMSLCIQDNGGGLAAGSVPANGLGLHLMRYRAVALSADCSISTPRNGGTAVTVNYPCTARPAIRRGG